MGWWDVAAAQDGVITFAQLIAAGRGGSAIDAAVERGELVRISKGVYLTGGAPLTTRARLWAAVCATDGTLCRSTAGWLWGVVDDQPGEIHVHVPHTRRVAMPAGVRVHRCRAAGPRRERCGLPVFGRSDTVVELVASLRGSDASRLADRALQRGWLHAADIERRLTDQPRRPGNAQLRRLLAQLGDGAAAESERVLHRLLRRAGIIGWHPNHQIWVDGDLVAVVDVALPTRRVAIEVDGMAYHVDVDRFRHDRSRQNALVMLGWTVLRFTWADLTERPGYVIAMVERAAA